MSRDDSAAASAVSCGTAALHLDRLVGAFTAFWTADGRVTAGMNVDVRDVTGPVQALIRSRRQVQPARLADPDTPLELLAG